MTALLAVCIGQLLRQKASAMAFPLSLAALLALLVLLLPQAKSLLSEGEALLSQAGLEGNAFFPLGKALASAELTRISAELCRDNGEKALAAAVEFCGAGATLWCVFPLAKQALLLISAIGE